MGQIDAILLLLPGTIRIFLGKIFETDELTDVKLGRFQSYESHVSVFPRSGHKQTDLHSTSLGHFQRYDLFSLGVDTKNLTYIAQALGVFNVTIFV